MTQDSSSKTNSIIAILVGLMALFVSLWVGVETRWHNRLVVRPRISIEHYAFGPKTGVWLVNHGLGPALIDEIHVYIDGKFYGKAPDALDSLSGVLGLEDLTVESLHVGKKVLWVKSGAELKLIGFPEVHHTAERLERVRHAFWDRLQIYVYYNSLYDELFRFPPTRDDMSQELWGDWLQSPHRSDATLAQPIRNDAIYAREVYTVFFSILYGVMLNGLTGLKPYNWGKWNQPKARRRMVFGFACFNVIPFIMFAIGFDVLGGAVAENGWRVALLAFSTLSVFAPYRAYHFLMVYFQQKGESWGLYLHEEYLEIVGKREIGQSPRYHFWATVVYLSAWFLIYGAS